MALRFRASHANFLRTFTKCFKRLPDLILFKDVLFLRQVLRSRSSRYLIAIGGGGCFLAKKASAVSIPFLVLHFIQLVTRFVLSVGPAGLEWSKHSLSLKRFILVLQYTQV